MQEGTFRSISYLQVIIAGYEILVIQIFQWKYMAYVPEAQSGMVPVG
jgi:hypothetical protein